MEGVIVYDQLLKYALGHSLFNSGHIKQNHFLAKTYGNNINRRTNVRT